VRATPSALGFAQTDDAAAAGGGAAASAGAGPAGAGRFACPQATPIAARETDANTVHALTERMGYSPRTCCLHHPFMSH
jgi:hypothetical protein